MKRSKFTDEQILAIVKEGEAGRKVADVCRTHGITEQTYYSRKAKYGGMESGEAEPLKQLEDDDQRLKQLLCRVGNLLNLREDSHRYRRIKDSTFTRARVRRYLN